MSDDQAQTEATAEKTAAEPYRVLARKYRPQSFADMIGQEALVTTLANAIEGGRLPHAIILTGVRGVGKTTTARIIAKAVNYAGPDGTAGPTVGDTSDCPICQAIAEDRHPDVMEMDAASRTGVGDIRELIEGVRYRPGSARYKIYIIDEVHMLSRNAFNALLKTLEEPPESVLFIFATTEIRKVPVTVLSRCMRFDLKRVEPEDLAAHFARICEKEGVAADQEALKLISKAADGSVRDGLSLLDQAIAVGENKVELEAVKAMLGLSDRGRLYDLFSLLMSGDAPGALGLLGELYAGGADPLLVIQDLMEVTHAVTRSKLVPDLHDSTLAEGEQIKDLAGRLGMAVLGRTWQMLLKGLAEVQNAPDPLRAAEMVLIRLIYLSELPDPSQLIKDLKEGASGQGLSSPQSPTSSPSASSPSASSPSASSPSASSPSASSPSASQAPSSQAPQQELQVPSAGGTTMSGGMEVPGLGSASRGPSGGAGPRVAARSEPLEQGRIDLTNFEQVVQLLRDKGELRLAAQLHQEARLVQFRPGHLELNVSPGTPKDFAGNLGRILGEATGRRWTVALTAQQGQATLAEVEEQKKEARRRDVMADPMVKEVLETFPGAKLFKIGDPKPALDEESPAASDQNSEDDPPEQEDER